MSVCFYIISSNYIRPVTHNSEIDILECSVNCGYVACYLVVLSLGFCALHKSPHKPYRFREMPLKEAMEPSRPRSIRVYIMKPALSARPKAHESPVLRVRFPGLLAMRESGPDLRCVQRHLFCRLRALVELVEVEHERAQAVVGNALGRALEG